MTDPLDDARAGFPSHGGGAKAIGSRAAVAKLLWNVGGERRIVTLKAFDAAVSALRPGDLEWICEFNRLAPIYFIPTTAWLRAFARQLRSLGVKRVLEVGAGDGLVSEALARIAPDLEVIATDSGAWSKASARMTAKEQHEHRNREVAGVALGADVERISARAAITKHKPDLVFGCWLPPGHALLDGLIRSNVKYVFDIGAAGGVTPGAWSWRYAHDLMEGPLEQLARCRLDERPMKALATRVTLYFGRLHADYQLERVREGDWLWQFRPAPKQR